VLGAVQAEPKGYLLHELDNGWSKPGISGDSDAGDRFLWHYLHLGHKRSFFKITSRFRNSILSGIVGIDQTGGSHVQEADMLTSLH
jgi:hypothetical protein